MVQWYSQHILGQLWAHVEEPAEFAVDATGGGGDGRRRRRRISLIITRTT